ncbi:serine/threonine protein kinase [Actinomadura barringtoniae]|uniref:non-specific serine/threonine protein kinase n=1 Tax=Actinomadura barringtoniae TaxID=1427535 RepID=A0A939P6J4_9ACTN|nr:serine/threonine-protein kinase [Actinomadura barringtoniae]MBO2446175.1 serine/threonine protein kinase [Actinomadura barringtoniae]
MPAPLEPTDPVRLGEHRLLGRLGEGGQGVVYLGETASGERVAVKLFHVQNDVQNDPVAMDTFERELDAATQVARFCISQVLSWGTIGNRRYIVSEYVDGPSLHHVVKTSGPRTGSALDRLAIATATALVALHDAGVVHRDFKPHNVLLGSDGPRVIDFGISRALTAAQTVASRVVGTPAYMAPEQLVPGELGSAVDVFAWASTMAFAATGRPPFGNESIPIVLNRVAYQEPELTGIEEPLHGLLVACLAKNPADRPTAQQVLDRLVRRTTAAPLPSKPPETTQAVPQPTPEVSPAEEVPTSALADPVTTEPPPPVQPPERGSGRRRAVVIGAGAVVAAIVLGGGAVKLLADDGGSSHASPPSTAPRTAGPATTGAPSGRTGNNAPAPNGKISPSPSSPGSSPSKSSRPSPSTSPSKGPVRRVELGPGHFSAYCVHLGWEFVEYRDSPTPGAYCVRHKHDQSMLLSTAQRDQGCQWRYDNPRARHYWKGKSNYCYAMQ